MNINELKNKENEGKLRDLFGKDCFSSDEDFKGKCEEMKNEKVSKIINTNSFNIYSISYDDFVITNKEGEVLKLFNVYDYNTNYETKYEIVFIGHETNTHIDKETLGIKEYYTR